MHNVGKHEEWPLKWFVGNDDEEGDDEFNSECLRMYSVSQKNVAPLKLFVVLSLLVNLSN